MIVARASTEAPGQGIIGAVATSVQGMIPGSDSEAVDYPATLQNLGCKPTRWVGPWVSGYPPHGSGLPSLWGPKGPISLSEDPN